MSADSCIPVNAPFTDRGGPVEPTAPPPMWLSRMKCPLPEGTWIPISDPGCGITWKNEFESTVQLSPLRTTPVEVHPKISFPMILFESFGALWIQREFTAMRG